jgi:hypothetical protein
MKSSTQDQVEGKIHVVKGKVKEIAGRVTDNPALKLKVPLKRSAAAFRIRLVR